MKPQDPLLAAWEEMLARDDRPALFNTRGQVIRTFRQIEHQAHEFESKIDMFPVGSVIPVQIGNHEEWPAIFLACFRRRLVVLPIDESISEPQRRAAFKICAVVAGVVIGGRTVEVVPAVTPAATSYWEEIPALLKLTSGTTAAPRAIRFRSEQLLADCDQICATMGIEDGDLNFGAIPISHSYGFSNLLTPLIARAVPLVLSRDRTPRAVLADLARTGATVFPGTPVFYQAFCDMGDVPPLPKVRLCISAGAPLSIRVAKSFFEKFRQPIHSFYGASECGGICYDRCGTKFEDVIVGQPIQGVDVELI